MATAQVNLREANAHADEIVKEIRANDSAWDADYLLALTRNKLSRWYGEGRDEQLASQVFALVNNKLGFTGEDSEVTVDWVEDQAELRRRELIEAQETVVDEIELAKESLESANERKKAAQAAIDEEDGPDDQKGL